MKTRDKKGVRLIGKLLIFAAILAADVFLIGQTSITVHAEGTTTVTAASAKVRESASTDSEVVSGVVKGNTLTVLSQTTGKDGYTWYKVYVDGTNTGYIRADLVSDVKANLEVESGSNASSATQSTSENTTASSTEKKEETKKEETKKEESVKQEVHFVQVSDTDVTAAKVVGGSKVNVRSNPSTSASKAGTANEGTEVTVSGEATDNSGKLWYQISFGDVSGFIRSDYLEVIATAEEEAPVEEAPVEEAPVEETQEETSTNKEYELVFEANPEGVEEWFLYDHNRGTKKSLADLLAVVKQTQDNENNAVKQLKTLKIVVIVMVAVILALVIGVTLLVFKLRDSYEYEDDDDEDDDDEDDDDEEDDEEDEEEDDEPVVKKPMFKKTTPVQKAAPQQSPTPKQSQSWQSKNFLDIDDDMEFEFLDIK